MQALPYNQGVDARAARGTIERSKQRITPAATLATAETSIVATSTPEATAQTAKPSQTKKNGARTAPSSRTPVATASTEVAEVEIDDEDDEGEPDAAAAAAARMASELAEVSALTGQPLEQDELLYAVPMCAPYDALAKCKYRVKLVPGPQKKGKAAKQALEVLSNAPTCTARCALLKYMKDENHV